MTTIYVFDEHINCEDDRGFPTPEDSGSKHDKPLKLTGVAEELWHGYWNRTTDGFVKPVVGAILADRVEEYPHETNNPKLAVLMAGYLRREFHESCI